MKTDDECRQSPDWLEEIVAAGCEMYRILSIDKNAHVDEWATETEIDAAITNWRNATMKTDADTYCERCRHWDQLSERMASHFPFARRLTEKHGRTVRLGFCRLTDSGPTADRDYCDKGEEVTGEN